MKKIILGLSLLVGFGVYAQASEVAKGLTHTHLVSSGSAFDRGTLMFMECSTVPTNSILNANYVQFFDTIPINTAAGGAGFLAFTGSTANIATPPLMLSSSGTFNTTTGFGNGGIFRDWGPYGVSISREAYFYFGGAPISGWGGCTVLWRREE